MISRTFWSLLDTTKALTKGYAMGSAALASLLLFQAFVLEVARYQAKLFDLTAITAGQASALADKLSSLGIQLALNHPAVVIGALVGAMLPFVFSGTAISAVGNGAYKMVEEVRRQFREIPGLREGTGKPDYAIAVDISTKAALRLMVAPGLIAVVTPLAIGIILEVPNNNRLNRLRHGEPLFAKADCKFFFLNYITRSGSSFI